MSSIRVLVVEDFDPFRRFIVSKLQTRPEFQFIGEASDGLEAVQKAQELQPDLIMMDIGLPSLNGIEAARQIRKLSPESKIIFFSQESSADAVHEALSLGAHGYVVKARAGRELLAAVEAVLQGTQFVSSGSSGHRFTAAAADRFRQGKGLPLSSPRKGTATRNHEVCFYSDDASFLLGHARFIESALRAGNPAIVVATESHQKSFLQSLQAHGVDSAAAIEQGRYIPLDVAEMLSRLMVNDLPDPVRFSRVAGNLLMAATKAAKREQPRVAVCGEAVSVLWTQGKGEAAVQLEHLWDEMTKVYDLDILCGYVLTSAQLEREQDIYQRVCAEHSGVCLQ
jgi:DNA-binding NarL/FixJ family response regulator